MKTTASCWTSCAVYGGGVILSAYNHPIYTKALKGWHKVELEAYADGARKRVEVLWINQQAWQRLEHPPLLRQHLGAGEAA